MWPKARQGRDAAGAANVLKAGVRPRFAAFQRAALGPPPVEWKEHSAPSRGANGIPALSKPSLDVGPPSVLAPSLAAARYQKLPCRRFAFTLSSHSGQC